MRPVVAVVLISIAFPAVRADEPTDPLRALMPKAQVDVLERLDRIADAEAKVAEEKNGLKRKELLEKIAQDGKAVEGLLRKTLAEEGLKGWIGKAKHSGYKTVGGLRLTTDDKRISIFVPYDGMKESVRKVVREVEDGTALRITTGKLPKTSVTSLNDIKIAGSSVTSIESAVK